MAGLFDPLDRAKRQHNADNARVAAFRAELDKLVANSPAADNFDGLLQYRAAVEEVERKIAIAEGVSAHSKKVLDREHAAAAVRAADDKYAAAKKLAEAHRDGTLEIVALSAKLAAKITENEAKRQKIASANLEREHRPYILDGEEQVRRIPERVIPAEYRDEVVWEDGGGNRPYTYRRGADGELEPAELGFTKKTKRVCQSEARTEPARMPRRLAEVVKLVDLAGNQIWPAQ